MVNPVRFKLGCFAGVATMCYDVQHMAATIVVERAP